MTDNGTTAEQLLLREWTQLEARLVRLRTQRDEVNAEIRDLVAERKVKARLVRIVAPELFGRRNGDDA